MGIKHSVTVVKGQKGKASDWNDDHVIDGDVDFQQFQALNLVIEKGTAFPAGPVAGQVFFRTDLNTFYVYDGTTWGGYAAPVKRYEYYNTGDDTAISAAAGAWKAQTFTVGVVGDNERHTTNYVLLKLYRVGSPGNITVSIREVDADGKPTGTDKAVGTIDGNAITDNSAGAWYKIPLTAYELQQGTKYAIVIRAPAAPGGNVMYWRMDQTAPAYTGGEQASSSNSGVTWTLFNEHDCMFEEWGRTA